MTSRRLGRVARAPLYAMDEYVSLTDTGIVDPASEAIRALKRGEVDARELDDIAARAADFIDAEIGAVDVIVPMPRRTPGAPSDLVPLAVRIARELGAEVRINWLVRVEAPRGGRVDRRRERFTAAEHARTMTLQPADVSFGARVLVLDNVLTTGGTLRGALSVLGRAGYDAVGFAVLHDRAA